MFLYFEDFAAGQVFKTLGVTVTEESVIRFALEYDFQPFHVDRIAAKDSIFKGLVASGIHTLALTFRLCNQAQLFTGNAVAGLGLDDVRFLRPVYAGDTIRAVVTVADRRPSVTHRNAGVVKWTIETLNQDDQLVFKAKMANLIKRRPAASEK